MVASLSVLGTSVAVLSLSPRTASASVGSDRVNVRLLEQRIASEGVEVQSLVARYDSFEGRMITIDGQITSGHARLVDDQRAETDATLRLRSLTIAAYININAASSATTSILASADTPTVPEQEVYLGVVGGSLDAAVASLQTAHTRTAAAQSALRAEQADIAATLRQLTAARRTAEAAVQADLAMLRRVSANLLSLVTAANARNEAAAEAQEEKEQAEQQQAHLALDPPSAPRPPPPVHPVAPPHRPARHDTGNYQNPLRGVSDLIAERIDQGVDYCGFGPVYAVGDGVVISTVNSGWPAGTFIVYRLTDGPANGLVVYTAEDLDPTVQVGETVTPDTVLGQLYEGPNGMEIGWADPSGDGTTMAADNGQYDGGNSTEFGYNFSQLLQSVGAPAGVLSNDPPTGGLPAGWPQW